jgi:hypothetical protein
VSQGFLEGDLASLEAELKRPFHGLHALINSGLNRVYHLVGFAFPNEISYCMISDHDFNYSYPPSSILAGKQPLGENS